MGKAIDMSEARLVKAMGDLMAAAGTGDAKEVHKKGEALRIVISNADAGALERVLADDTETGISMEEAIRGLVSFGNAVKELLVLVQRWRLRD